jgi:hypothetical protein
MVKPGGFWANQPEDLEPLDYDIYDDREATDEERLLSIRLVDQVVRDRNYDYDHEITAKAVAAALARQRVALTLHRYDV